LPATLLLNEIVKEKPIVLENIFYDFDKADIRSDAALELDKLVQVLNDNPTISIELSSHTDSRGSDIYNQDLSQRRAQSAVNYIISKGIDRNRITAKGYGESRPVVRNAKTEEQHQLNRRTEFKVVRITE
jgi:peptidoglycan-associated lipoprotein